MQAQKVRKTAESKFEKSVTKRGTGKGKVDSKEKSPVGTAVVIFFIFVVVGSSVIQLLRTYMSGSQSDF